MEILNHKLVKEKEKLARLEKVFLTFYQTLYNLECIAFEYENKFKNRRSMA